AGAQFSVAVFLAPRAGLISRWLRNQALAVRIAAEDVLARLYRAEEQGFSAQGSGFSMASGGRKPAEEVTGIVAWLARWRLARSGWINREPQGALQLTSAGRAA